MNKVATLLTLLIVISGSLFAQKDYHSCHQTKKKVKPTRLTQAEKAAMAVSVARSDTFDIVHYDIHLDVRDYTNDYLIANTHVTYSPKMDDVTSITLDLFELTVDSVKMDGAHLDYTHEDGGWDLVIELPSPTVTGEEHTIDIWYQGVPHLDPQWGGFYFQNNYIYNLGIGISTIPPNFGKVWYPCFDTYVERALYDFHVTSDDDWKAYCQGDLIEEQDLGDGNWMRHYSLDKPIPTYLSAVAVADYESTEFVHTGAYGDIPIRLTSKPTHQTTMQNKFVGLGDAIDACEYWYGPEYWEQIGYVITVDGAMEHPTNIAYPQATMTSGSLSANQGLLTHELGHHWWGDMVSQSSYHHMWLKEGPAEYSIHLMREWVGGDSAYVQAVKDNHLSVMESAHLSDEGYYPLSPMPEEHIYGVHSYDKGASIMHSMRGYMGDDNFRTGLQTTLDSMLHGVLDPETFKGILSESTGVPMDDFFDDWVYNPGFASFEINSVDASTVGAFTNSFIVIEQKLREANTYYNNVPLTITTFDEFWNMTHHPIMSNGQEFSVNIETEYVPAFYVINAMNELNLAKMDHREIYTEPTSMYDLPYVSFRTKCLEIDEEAQVWVEHQWIGADQDNLADNIDEISNVHYWIVHTDMSENTHIQGRVSYQGAVESHLDYDLFNDTEEGGMLAYRASPDQPWIEFPYYLYQPGSLTNGNGTILIDSLIAGEYAFAKGNPEFGVGIEELTSDDIQMQLYPNPVSNMLNLEWEKELGRITVSNVKGQVVIDQAVNRGQNRMTIDVSDLANANYMINVYDVVGNLIDQKKLVKE